MQIEFLENGSPDCPLIRIFGDDPAGMGYLYDALLQLAESEINEVKIHDLPSVKAVEGCKLFAKIGKVDKGIKRIEDSNAYECILTKDTWLQVAGLLEPFCKSPNGNFHQWLDKTSDISLLVTNSSLGEW